MRPLAIPSYVHQLWKYDRQQLIAQIQSHYAKLLKGPPDVSVVIPAYNEEQCILTTLLSIAQNVTTKSVEIIVVNNNSTDETEKLVLAAGVKCISETKIGPTFARGAGLLESKSTYIINADADSIYPPTWVETMISPYDKEQRIANTYGRFAFLPSEGTSRFSFFLYENAADMLRWSRRTFKEPAMYVYGCNSTFRREQGLAVNGYDHPPGTNEDGYLALKLREKGFGKLHYISSNKALVWTVDRHLQKDGGLWPAMLKRVKETLFK
jgi:glycosyltransferase involved in cell wall biosynthesis